MIAASPTLARDTRGAIAVVVLFMAVFLVAVLFHVVDLGGAILYRERMQDAADAAAYTSAATHARGMNVLALMNMVMAALLAVLIALSMMETMIVAAMAVISACMPVAWVPPCPALLPTLPLLEGIRQDIDAARETVRPTVLSSLEMLHVAEVGVRKLVPLAATGTATLTVLEHYAPPAVSAEVFPARPTLPTSDDTYTELCGRAGRYVGDMVVLPFEWAHVPSLLTDAAAKAVGSLAKSDPGWFCAGTDPGAKHPGFEQEITQTFPQSAKQRACDDADVLTAQGQALCEQAAQESRAGVPDLDTGECSAGCDRAAYDWRARNARLACDPNEHGKRRYYQWQERKVIKRYRRGSAGWIWVRDEPEAPIFRSGDEKHPARLPCPREAGRVDWNTSWELDEHGARTPVCSYLEAGANTERRVVIEVLQVFGCSEEVKRKHELHDLSKDPDLGAHEGADNSRAPQKIIDGVKLGDDTFQLRAIVHGDVPRSYAGIIDLAAWGAEADGRVPYLPQGVEQLQVAQAEYFFAGKAKSPHEWLWNMAWKARLRRVRAPRSSASISPKLADFGDLLVH